MTLIDPGAPRFKAGQRVRPSPHGIARCIFPRARHQQSGIVVKVDEFGCPTVRWDGRRGANGYHPSFIAPDRRRKR